MTPTERTSQPAAVSVHYDEKQLRHNLLSALIVDDEETYSGSLRDLLDEIGYNSEVANSLDRARTLLSRKRYSFVLCDNVFVDPKFPRGSEFIAQERHLLRDANVFLVTGYAVEQIVNRKTLEDDLSVTILRKGPGHTRRLQEIARTIASERLSNAKAAIEGFIGGLTQNVAAPSSPGKVRMSFHLVDRAVERLKQYILALPNQSEDQFFLFGQLFSPKDLLRELDRGSDVAMELVDMFLDDTLEVEDGEQGE